MATANTLTEFGSLTGVQKAGILMLALDIDAAGLILREMDEENIEDLTREMASMGIVPDAIRYQVVEEFYGMMMAQLWSTEGGLDYAKALLKNHLDPKTADKIIQQISQHVQQTPFAFLQKAESANLLTFIQDEHPQTIALIVSHLPFHKSAEVLQGLPAQKQVEVVKRVANMEQTNPEVIQEVEAGLEIRLANLLSQSFEKAGGVPTVAEMLNLIDRSTEKSIMEGLEAEDPDLVEQIRRLMFVFEDILLVDPKGIQAVLKEVDNDELGMALKTASDELKDSILGNMSARAQELIREDMEFMGPVRITDVEAAQQRVVDIVRRLEESGEIIIAGRGGADLIV